jgi:hypothetical protein
VERIAKEPQITKRLSARALHSNVSDTSLRSNPLLGPAGDNPCASLRAFGRQKCVDGLWTVNNAEEFVAPLFYSFDGSVKVTNSFVVVSDIRIGG